MSQLVNMLGRQLASPTGVGGWFVVRAMRLLNRRSLRLAVAALEVRRGDAVLDLGCGDGAAIPALMAGARTGAVCGVDYSARVLALARRRFPDAQFRRGRFEALPYASGVFDRVLAANVAYFWNDPETVASEIDRVLKPGGRAAIYVTDGAALARLGLDRSGTHRLLREQDVRAIVGPCGSVVAVDGGFGTPGWVGTWTKAEGARP